LLEDDFIRRALFNTVYLSAIAAVIAVVIAYPIALRVARRDDRLSKILFVSVLSVMFTSHVVRSLGWRAALSNGGVVSDVVGALGGPSDLGFVPGRIGVMIAMAHAALPFTFLVLLPVVEAVPARLEEAAKGLGAYPLRVLTKVTLPLSSAGVLGALLLAFATGTAAFTAPAILGGGQVTVLGTAIRQQMSVTLNYTMAAALAAAQLLVVLLIVVVAMRAARFQKAGALEGSQQ
jgi:putative spermidine/putrescine transport system permease protein